MNIENAKSQMRKGMLEYCVLLLLRHGPSYASDIIQQLKQAELLVVEGTLYPLLTRLKNDGLLQYEWQESTQGPPRKYYALSAEGEKFLDRPTEQGTVLYLDLEDPESRLIQRARGIRDVIPSKFHEATKAGRLGGGLTEQIEDFVKEHPDTNLVVIDTLQKIRKPKGDTYAGDYAVISALKNLADRLDIAIVCIHHTRKMKAKDTFDSVLGSTGLTAAADGIYVLERKADGKPFGRLSYISRDLPDGDLPVRFDHDTCRWYPIASIDMERELLLADEAMSALVSFMKQELIYEGTATDLCERLGLNIGANNLSSKLSKYKNSLQKLGVDYTKEKRNNHKVFTLNYNRKEPEYDGTMKSAYTPEALEKPGEKPFVGVSENGLHRTA